MKAVVLAAGKGEGLYPYTKKQQKETISILGKQIISYVLEGIKKAGINEAIIVTNENTKKDLEITTDISYELVNQKRPGITGATIDGMEKIDDDTFLLAFGDIIAPPEFYMNLMNSYVTGSSKAVFSLVPVYEGMQTYGLAKIVDDKIEITKENTTLALAGAYIIPKGDFTDLLEYFNKLSKTSRYFIWSGKWIDIGYPEDLINAIELLLSDKKTIISENAEISKSAIIGKGIIIEDNAIIDDYSIIKGPAYIGKEAYIGSYSLIRDYTSIEKNAKIGAYTEITHSLIEENSEIGSKSYLTFSIIGKNTKIGASTITVSYPANPIRSKQNKLGALISPNEEIPHGSIIGPNFKK
ncbi:NTP transferase domain-containing protein [Acidianus sulfidivorans JP7]|uniref:Nucleotidyltransferase n=1 Tax=Acidianus sulfidivorans JP7 TaxID=619593 RepID=A0A2U9IP67_9CREN|nr:NDP-sugar synthase [Acidianus sulfidivorans]AWR97838.1 NTP transferase domain-containing protein [Acidianus sulfidivorans JP7]